MKQSDTLIFIAGMAQQTMQAREKLGDAIIVIRQRMDSIKIAPQGGVKFFRTVFMQCCRCCCQHGSPLQQKRLTSLSDRFNRDIWVKPILLY